jgi:hypothetical protein
LAEVFSVDDTGYSKEKLRKEDVLSIFSNFIVQDSSGNAQFAHLSVQEYLQRRNGGKDYSFDQCHRHIATTCLAHMIHHGVHFDDMRGYDDPLIAYSLIYWAGHWRIAVGKRSGDLEDRYVEFLGMGRPESRWRSGSMYSIR